MSTNVQNLPGSAKTAENFKDPVYLRLRDLVYQSCGIYHPEEKLYLLAGACNWRIAGAKTCLFRSRPQLEALRNVILPELCAVRGKIGVNKSRVWSAGCSTGEESYTLAMTLLEEREKLLQGWTFEISATDLNDRSLETAKAGVYGSYALRNTPEYFKQKYFHPDSENKLQVNDSVKQCISFSRLNLNDDGKMLFMKGMDLIFCCHDQRCRCLHQLSASKSGYWLRSPAHSNHPRSRLPDRR